MRVVDLTRGDEVGEHLVSSIFYETLGNMVKDFPTRPHTLFGSTLMFYENRYLPEDVVVIMPSDFNTPRFEPGIPLTT